MLIPLKLQFSFIDDFDFKLKYAGIKLLPRQKDHPKSNTITTNNGENKQPNFFKRLYDENDFPNFCKIILSFLKNLFKELKYILKHIKVRKLFTDIVVASPDAAKTAIHYGIICTTFYNLLKYLDSITNIKIKKIDISSDFEKTKSSFNFSAEIKISPLFILISAIVIMKNYIQFTNREGSALDE